MIAKKLEHTPSFLQRLFYVLRGKDEDEKDYSIRAKHDHKIEKIDIIGANFKYNNPLLYDFNGLLMGVDKNKVYDIDNKFVEVSKKYRGNGNLFCAHFVLSLDENETLDKLQWEHALKIFLEEQGYTRNRYIAVRHMPSNKNTDKKEHMHIILQRVRDDNLSFVKEGNDYRRNESACRKIENLFGLKKVLSSHETWETRADNKTQKGIDKRKKENIKNGKDINDGLKTSDIPLLKSLLKDVIDNKKPKTMTEFVNELKKVNMQMHVKTKSGGYEIKGATFSYNGGKEIAGKNLHRHKCTWPKLIASGISYDAKRDNDALGLNKYATSLIDIDKVNKEVEESYKPIDIAPELKEEQREVKLFAMLRIEKERADSECIRKTNSIYVKNDS